MESILSQVIIQRIGIESTFLDSFYDAEKSDYKNNS